jgi:hypothetical protein
LGWTEPFGEVHIQGEVFCASQHAHVLALMLADVAMCDNPWELPDF